VEARASWGEDNVIDDDGAIDEDDQDPALVTLIFDLALRKVLAPGQPMLVTPGDQVDFIIEVHNQGTYIADNIEVTDFFPSNLILFDPLGEWTTGGTVSGLNTVSRTLTAANMDFSTSMPIEVAPWGCCRVSRLKFRSLLSSTRTLSLAISTILPRFRLLPMIMEMSK
jgi:uncharacterized repeat protein (TIGR01451 family)